MRGSRRGRFSPAHRNPPLGFRDAAAKAAGAAAVGRSVPIYRRRQWRRAPYFSGLQVCLFRVWAPGRLQLRFGTCLISFLTRVFLRESRGRPAENKRGPMVTAARSNGGFADGEDDIFVKEEFSHKGSTSLHFSWQQIP